jgi:hypothetical protein
MDKNPALAAFAVAIKTELVFGQVWIRRTESGFQLRHVADKEADSAALQLLGEKDLRQRAQFTERGAFRPLKSAPNLARGWRVAPRDEPALGLALNQLYPGAVADWFAAQLPSPPVTSYREFTNRQTGMYRITARLDDPVAGAVARACCHENFCLKRRLWTVEGQPPDAAVKKSLIPCLEPCAILVEFARKIARIEQGQSPPLPNPTEAEAALKNPDPTIAESDFDSPHNPRCLRFVLEKQPAADTSRAG